MAAAFKRLAAAVSEAADSGKQPEEWTPEQRKLFKKTVKDALEKAVLDTAGADKDRLRNFTNKSLVDISQVAAGIIEEAVKKLAQDGCLFLRDMLFPGVLVMRRG